MTKLFGKEKITVKSDERVRFTLPIRFLWNPKEDITTYELAQCIQYIGWSEMAGVTDLSLSFLRHFNIEDPNK